LEYAVVVAYWGEMIVAAARNASCRHLLIEVRMDGIEVVNPVFRDPESLL